MTKPTYGNIMATAVLIFQAGIWFGGMDAKNDLNKMLTAIDKKIDVLSQRQNAIEEQTLIWLEDAELQRLSNHKESMANIQFLHEYNKKRNPDYVAPKIQIAPYRQAVRGYSFK